MTVQSRKALSLIVLIVIVFLLPGFSQAQELVFEEDFSDPNLPGWEITPNVNVIDEVLHIEEEGFAYYPLILGGAQSIAPGTPYR